jgi:very-short-patch-repair endonuclease
MIAGLVARGEWLRVLPQVFLVSQASLDWNTKLHAAILWTGPNSFASHRSAAVLHHLRFGDMQFVEVTTDRRMRPRKGIKIHYDPNAHTVQTAKVDGIPCSLIPRTLFDLCEVLSEPAATVTVVEAVRTRRVDVPRLGHVLDSEGGPGINGTRVMRKIVTQRFALGVTDSEAEDLFAAMAKRRGYLFAFHHVVQDQNIYEQLDFAAIDELVDIEIDGGETHNNPAAVERDKVRDAELESRGWVVLRFPYWDLIERPDWVFQKVEMTLQVRRRLLAM